MTLAEFSIKKYYTTLSFTILIIILGIASYFSMPVQLNPDIDPVIITVVTNYNGVGATEVSASINEIIEEEIGSVEGVKKISSTAMEGTSIVTVEFGYDKDVDIAGVEVQNIISKIRNKLPDNIEEPEIRKFSSSDKPIITLSISGDYDLTFLRTLADNELKNNFQLIKGVASVNAIGGKKREIYVSVSQDKLETHNIPLSFVLTRINGQNINIPGGKISENSEDLLIRSIGKFENISDINNVVLYSDNNEKIYLRDVATVYDSYDDIKSKFKVKGIEGVGINIIKQQDANTLETAKLVKKEIETLKEKYPNIKFEIVDDQSNLVKIVVNNLGSSLQQGIILTIILIFLFLNNFRNTLAIVVSIPTTFVMTLMLMKIFGLSLNSTTMSALILSIGMLVDNSIVVIENITRHFQELKKDSIRASIDGTNEISLSVIAGTTTSMVVLFPVMFIGGFIEQAFKPLAITLLFSWIGSVVSSLTIIPMITSYILKRDEEIKRNKIVEFFHKKILLFGKALEYSKTVYIKLLKLALNYRKSVIFTGLILLGLSIFSIRFIGAEMIPVMDGGSSYISIEADSGSSLEKTENIVNNVEEILLRVPEIEIFSSQIGAEPGSGMMSSTGASGVGQANISITFSPRNERKKDIWTLQEEIRREIAKIPGIRSFVVKELGSTAIATTKAPLVVRISGENSELLEKISNELLPQINEIDGVTNLTSSWVVANPEYQFEFDRNKLEQLDLTISDVSTQIAMAINGVESKEKFSIKNNKDITIEIKYDKEIRKNEKDIGNINIYNKYNQKVPLRYLANIRNVKNQNIVTRENLSNSLDILGYVKDRPLSSVTKDVEKLLKNQVFPENYKVFVTGEKDDMEESIKKLAVSLVLAVIFVYFLLVSQFKSFLHPITIMIAIPLEIIGVVFALLLTGKYLSMPAIMGIILLTGIAVNDSIHLIDFAIEAKKEGLSPKDAMIEAGKTRFRPILMTTFSTTVGMLPLALELAIGAEKYSPLATVVIGGLTSSTLLLLFIVPVVYTSFEELKNRRTKI
ncbi:MAG: efflux RND transporter permease subunit [Leptotrichiaceae bacterium]|nr:efflux RND transporter permease subunit [Leptotrichiaceae bacterium]MBP7739771.1 efflux RND transporter permease subunit [Leptotrichiaceae bacterium]MBP9596699.1 efflux RND transporter permease subunit [Fusobacteriaceae bacterium]